MKPVTKTADKTASELSQKIESLFEKNKQVIRTLVATLSADTPQEDRDALAKSVEPLIKDK